MYLKEKYNYQPKAICVKIDSIKILKEVLHDRGIFTNTKHDVCSDRVYLERSRAVDRKIQFGQ